MTWDSDALFLDWEGGGTKMTEEKKGGNKTTILSTQKKKKKEKKNIQNRFPIMSRSSHKYSTSAESRAFH